MQPATHYATAKSYASLPKDRSLAQGNFFHFVAGSERIMKGVDAPIIPVNLDGVWGSIFSFERGRFLWKVPRRIPYSVTVSFGSATASDSTAPSIRAAVQELHTDAFARRKRSMKTLDRAFVRAARQRPWQFFMADGKTPQVSFASALTKTVFIARRLRREIGEQPMVGLLLPPSVGGALTNYALMLMGRHAGKSELHVNQRHHCRSRKLPSVESTW